MPGATRIRSPDDDPRADSPAGADFSRPAPSDRSWRAALRVALIYALVSAAWIALSDQVLARLIPDPQALHRRADVQGLGLRGGLGGDHLRPGPSELGTQQARGVCRSRWPRRGCVRRPIRSTRWSTARRWRSSSWRPGKGWLRSGIPVRRGSSAGRPRRSSGASSALRPGGQAGGVRKELSGGCWRGGAVRRRGRPATQGWHAGRAPAVDDAVA